MSFVDLYICWCLMQRDQLHQKEVLVSSLQHQLRKVTESRGTRGQQLGGEGEGNLAWESSILKDNNARLTEELWRMKERNKELEEVRLFSVPCLDLFGHSTIIFGSKPMLLLLNLMHGILIPPGAQELQ